MKAIEILNEINEDIKSSVDYNSFVGIHFNIDDQVRIEKAIEELQDLQNENKSLVKTLEKYNEEMIELRKENQDLKNSNNELLEYLRSTQKKLEEWLGK